MIVKDEGRLPTGSFKARGLGMAVSMAKSFGIKRMAMPANGNAGAALAAYASACSIESYAFCPSDTPEVNVREVAAQGGRLFRVNGLIHQCGALVGGNKEAAGWFDVSTLKEPYRIEGKKTMGIELAWQMGWTLPDAIFYPTGGMALGVCADFCVGVGLDAFPAPCWCDQPTPAMVWCQDAVVAGEIDPRFWYQSS